MTDVAPRTSVLTWSGARVGPLTPFMVSGKVHGRSLSVLVNGLADVVAQIADWTSDDPDASGSWGLRDDYSESLMIPVRQPVGAERERRRAAHMVALVPGKRLGSSLLALCGEVLPLVGIDVVALGTGMPCEECLTMAASDRGAAAPGRLPLFRRIQPELDSQIG